MHLQQIHAACHPGANNHLDRDDDTQAFLDAALSGVADGEVMSREELLVALKEEVDLENRPHPGEGRPWQLLEEGGFGIDTNSIRTSRTVFVPVVAGVKHSTLISTIARLHQHQRTKKTATIDGNAVTYIEATIGDIELANRLAACWDGHSVNYHRKPVAWSTCSTTWRQRSLKKPRCWQLM
jgi:hypothetical protein